MSTCNAATEVLGAHGCPRLAGHPGEHYWWIPWEGGDGIWRVIVYSGSPYERRKRARGRFSAPPSAADVNLLLRTLSPLRKKEAALRTPQSEPQPAYRTVVVRGGMAVVTDRPLDGVAVGA